MGGPVPSICVATFDPGNVIGETRNGAVARANESVEKKP